MNSFNTTIAPGLAKVYKHYQEQKAVPWSSKLGTTQLIPKVTGVTSIEELRPIPLELLNVRMAWTELATSHFQALLGTLAKEAY